MQAESTFIEVVLEVCLVSLVHVLQYFYDVSRILPGSVYKMAYCLGKGLSVEVVLTVCHLYYVTWTLTPVPVPVPVPVL